MDLDVYEKFKSSHISKCHGKPIYSDMLMIKTRGEWERFWMCSECNKRTTPIPKIKRKDPF